MKVIIEGKRTFKGLTDDEAKKDIKIELSKDEGVLKDKIIINTECENGLLEFDAEELYDAISVLY